MASGSPTTTSSSLLLFFLLSCLLVGQALCNQGRHGSISDYGEQYAHQGLTEEHMDLQENIKEMKYARAVRQPKVAKIYLFKNCSRICKKKCVFQKKIEWYLKK
ncbi:hypothetical protein ZWY2020_036470 [Hordeum vulgare]|nr:hypothetical protein ZWY2020_036470 [Hordeum vulgare]